MADEMTTLESKLVTLKDTPPSDPSGQSQVSAILDLFAQALSSKEVQALFPAAWMKYVAAAVIALGMLSSFLGGRASVSIPEPVAPIVHVNVPPAPVIAAPVIETKKEPAKGPIVTEAK